MKSLKLIAAVAVALAALACNKEQALPEEVAGGTETQTPQNGQSEEAGIPEGYVRLTFTTPADTKTALDKESGAVSWSKNDSIKICWDGGYAISKKVVISDGIARFTADVKEAAEDLYAVYPSSINASVSNGSFNVDIPKFQTGRFEDADIIVAKTTKTDLTYAFHHAVSLVRFVISEEGIARGITRAQFVDLANNSCLYGTLGITFSGTDIDKITEPTAEANDVIDIEEVAAGDNWIAVPPTKHLTGYGLRMGTSDAWLPGIVGEKPYAFDAAGKRLGLGTVDEKINDGEWYIKPEATGTGDGKSWTNAGGPELLQSLLGDTAEYNGYKNLARSWRLDGKTINVAEGYYSASASGGFTSSFDQNQLISFTIRGGYTSEGVESSSAKTVFGPETETESKRAFFFYNGVDATLENLYIQNHIRTNNLGGAALYVAGSTNLTIKNSFFTGNNLTAESSRYGGALSINGTGKLSISGTSFERNHSDTAGGAIYVSTTGKVTISDNCSFDGNDSGTYAGAIFIANNAEITDCSFTENEAVTGGALTVGSSGSATVSGCSFNRNAASTESKSNGGAIYANGSLAVSNSTFTGNSVTKSVAANNEYGNGGAIYINKNVTTLTSCVFSNNVASDGGAIFLMQTGSLRVDRCKFIGNHTDGNRWYETSKETPKFNGREGSGVFAFQDATYAEGNLASAYFNACEFRDNYAVSSVIQCSNITYAYAEATALGYNNCVFYGNDDDSKLDASKAGWGAYSRGSLIMVNSTMIENCSNAVIYSTGAGSFVYNNVIISTGAGAGIRGLQSKKYPSHGYNIISSYLSDKTNTLSNPGNEVEASALGSGAEFSYDTFAEGKAAGVSTGMSYYSWDGTTPAFTQTTKANVISQISTTDFYTWLNGLGALDTDIRGVTRSTGYWPGSYQN